MGARANVTDFYQNFRFHCDVAIEDVQNNDPLQIAAGGENVKDPSGGIAGFNNVTYPELSMNQVEYRDGISVWTKKQPGIPTFSDVSMMRGVAKRDTTFLDWAIKALVGDAYRATVNIYQWGQESTPNRDTTPGFQKDPQFARRITLHEAFPIRVKPGGDLDATSDEISLMEIDVGYEYIDIEDLVGA